MGENIKILEEFIKYYESEAISRKFRGTLSISVDEYDIDAIEHLIKAYKELEEENKQLEVIKDEAIRRYNFESISVSLVEEKIEEYTKLLKSCNRFSDVDRIKAINERILAYKELLEKR